MCAARGAPSAFPPCTRAQCLPWLQCAGMPSCASQSVLQRFVLQNPQPHTMRVIGSHSVLGNRAMSGKHSAPGVTRADVGWGTGMGISPRSCPAAPQSIINSLIIDYKFKLCSKKKKQTQKALREAEKPSFARKASKTGPIWSASRIGTF